METNANWKNIGFVSSTAYGLIKIILAALIHFLEVTEIVLKQV